MTTPMMKCGHAANSVHILPDGTEEPACAICAGLDPGAYIVAETPDLKGRRARCAYFGRMQGRSECPVCNRREDRICKCERDSSPELPFFKHKPDEEYDKFYCGCHSWD